MPRFLEIKNTLYFPRCVAIRPESGKKYGGWSAWKKFLKVAVFSAWRIVLQMPHFVEIKNILCFAKKSFAKIWRSNSRKKIPKYCPVSSMAQEPPPLTRTCIWRTGPMHRTRDRNTFANSSERWRNTNPRNSGGKIDESLVFDETCYDRNNEAATSWRVSAFSIRSTCCRRLTVGNCISRMTIT